MAVRVFDCCAVIAYANDEDGSDLIERILNHSEIQCIIHAVNVAECYKVLMRSNSNISVGDLEGLIADMGLAIREDMGLDFLKSVAEVWVAINDKVSPDGGKKNSISLADCFCIALARKERGDPLTCDRREFEYVDSSGLCKVTFFR